MTFKKILLLLLTLLLAGAAVASPGSYLWKLQELVRKSGESIELRDENGRIMKRVDVQQMLYIYSALQAIKQAAEIDAEVIIINGEQPNAFATKGKARPAEPGDKAPDPDDKSVQGQPVDEGEGKGEGKGAGKGDAVDDENAIDINLLGINFAMLDMLELDVNMMAALIGHELAHLKLKHGEELERNQKRTSVHTAGTTKYSRENEREADYLGAIWAVEAGYDPEGAVKLQDLIYKSSRFKGGAFVGSHPTSTERIAILKSLARRLSSK